MATDEATKHRARRKAGRQGLTVKAVRRFDPNASDYGYVELLDGAGERVIRKAGCSWASIEAYLTTPKQRE